MVFNCDEMQYLLDNINFDDNLESINRQNSPLPNVGSQQQQVDLILNEFLIEELLVSMNIFNIEQCDMETSQYFSVITNNNLDPEPTDVILAIAGFIIGLITWIPAFIFFSLLAIVGGPYEAFLIATELAENPTWNPFLCVIYFFIYWPIYTLYYFQYGVFWPLYLLIEGFNAPPQNV